jgi:hypothetical protein
MREREIVQWVVSLWWGQMGDVYVRLYKDAPEWVRRHAADRFGKRTVFLCSERLRPQAG